MSDPKEKGSDKPPQANDTDKSAVPAKPTESIAQDAAHLPPHKALLKKVQRKLDEEAPMTLGAKLSEKQLKDAEMAVKLGSGLLNVYPRISQEELQAIINEAVKNALPQKPKTVVAKIGSFAYNVILLGMMGNIAWDLLKRLIPYLHTFFGSADDPTGYMKRSTSAYQTIRDAGPEGFRDFESEHFRDLLAFRINTWQEIGKEMKAQDFGDSLSDIEIQSVLESLESHLFVPVRS